MTYRKLSWPPGPTDVRLASDEIHVWSASLEQPRNYVERLRQLLSIDEKRRVEQLRFERDRYHFIVGRGVLRIILSHYIEIDPDRIQLCYGTHGKPALVSQGSGLCCTLQFNVSHAQDLVVYALVQDRHVGIDIEYLRPIPEAEVIAKWLFSPQEQAKLSMLPPQRRLEGFLSYWTRKEAYLKALGVGLGGSADPDHRGDAFSESKNATMEGQSHEGTRWFIQHLVPAPGYIGALATQGQELRLSYWQWVMCAR